MQNPTTSVAWLANGDGQAEDVSIRADGPACGLAIVP